MTCANESCKQSYERTHSRQRYCSKSCAKTARQGLGRVIDAAEFARRRQEKAESSRKGEILRRLQLQEIKLLDAQKRMDEIRLEAAREGVLDVDAHLDEALRLAQERFEKDAASNADNVTANRVKEFLSNHRDMIYGALTRFSFARGYTMFDVDAMWAKMVGNPRPIVIEPERPVSALDFLDGEDEAA